MLSLVMQVPMRAGVLEGVAHDALAARAGDQLQALHHLVALPVLDAGVGVFLVLAHDHHVHAGVAGIDEGMVGHAGPHIGVEPERLADGDVEALVAAALRRGDRAFEVMHDKTCKVCP